MAKDRAPALKNWSTRTLCLKVSAALGGVHTITPQFNRNFVIDCWVLYKSQAGVYDPAQANMSKFPFFAPL